jgi:hypothetical protein
LISGRGAGAGQLGHQRQNVPRGRVAGGDVGEVHQVVTYRVEGSGCGGGRLGQRLCLDAATGRFFELGSPVLLPDGQVMRWGHPRRVRQGDLRLGGQCERHADDSSQREFAELEHEFLLLQ